MADLSFINDIHAIAIVGASKKRNYFFLRTFHDSFKGRIYAIKPGAEKIDEFPDVDVYERVTDVPEDEPVDFVFIEIPREQVPKVISDCAAKGVKLAAIFSSGFADANTDEGRALQAELLQAAAGVTRMLGPNGMGLYFPRLGIRWRSSLPLEHGTIGLMVQSGGFSNLLIHGLTSEGMPISKAFSIGNAADINAIDVISYFKDDPETTLIVIYLEGLPAGRGHEFMEMLQACEKPVIFIKGGKTTAGSRAITSHTASLAGNYAIWDAAIHQSGGILVETFDDVISAGKYLSMIGNKPVRNVCLMTLSGGYAVICSDVLASHGIVLPKLSEKTRESLGNILIASGTSMNNPVDVGALINEVDKLEAILDILLVDDSIDGVIFEINPVHVAAQVGGEPLEMALPPMLERIKQRHEKLIMTIIENVGYDEIKQDFKQRFRNLGIPVYDDIMQVARTLKFINKTVAKGDHHGG
ncbi:MAG TPA: CoA-binding protein [Candidatus Lokiarchaeia archaeon]|nr:CoA-binding protein [Candidatus Lokiarchaeia archaeon]